MPSDDAAGPIRVLYAEDNALDADLTRAHFLGHAPDFAIEIVGTGRECLERVRAAAPDVLLLDQYLPDMEGLDVLRALARSGESFPVVLASGAGDEDLVVKALRLGAANYVPKSGDYLVTLPDLLRTVIEEHRRDRSRGLLSARPRRILYVEHNEMDVELTSRHFAEALPEVELDVVRSFAAALERLERPPAYDAVLMDVRMPGQSGLEFVRETRRRGVRMPPFIMITGKGDEATAIASLKLGAADYVTKREGYLEQLGPAVERAVAHDRLERLAAQLHDELARRERVEADRLALQAQLLQAQRMEGIGRLAGGVAHDFNNVLSVILTYTGFVLREMPADDPLRSDLLEVLRGAERAAAMTRQLLAFSRGQVLQAVPLGLNDVAAGMEQMLRRMLGEDIDFAQVLAPDLGVIHADPAQLEQVIMNLVVNARDAMANGGKLTLETSNVDVDEERAARHPGLRPGPHVQLAVTDDGCGMDAHVKAKLFEPFFTTKEKGKGTGLGLSTVYGIVKQSGGDVWAYSEPGRGTTFKVLLPRHPAAAPVARAAPVDVTRVEGTETILLVEDDEQVLQVSRRSLEAAGYTVLTASDGEKAIDVAARHPGEIHLLFTDIVMPRMSGCALAKELARARPGMKVLYTSGYAGGAVVEQGVLDARAHFVTKPFTAADLQRRVREVLDGTERGAGAGAGGRPG
ncbi:MAG TPA: response regulator [Anaeromyxobacter sp.]|nr:response regulator [Anaeromyxobacter sp.]